MIPFRDYEAGYGSHRCRHSAANRLDKIALISLDSSIRILVTTPKPFKPGQRRGVAIFRAVGILLLSTVMKGERIAGRVAYSSCDAGKNLSVLGIASVPSF
ncbi:hypothetical protein M378DRAFT_458295 [Amanita muscaria Koide BX008]|uniref:Uncharacterized protein n=1 Tax=Amanita muscaria (strain Koide BX008) TaxID=946122 RepID=A0A0C2WVC2_AMAMK|nr:hypothetical protein M378DRAFT_458295 [Amanita muscaria Koide BX008]